MGIPPGRLVVDADLAELLAGVPGPDDSIGALVSVWLRPYYFITYDSLWQAHRIKSRDGCWDTETGRKVERREGSDYSFRE